MAFKGEQKQFGSVLRLSWDYRLFHKDFVVFQCIGQEMSHAMAHQQGEQVQARSFFDVSSNPLGMAIVTLIEPAACGPI